MYPEQNILKPNTLRQSVTFFELFVFYLDHLRRIFKSLMKADKHCSMFVQNKPHSPHQVDMLHKLYIANAGSLLAKKDYDQNLPFRSKIFPVTESPDAHTCNNSYIISYTIELPIG